LSFSYLPAVNAALNLASALFLVMGYWFIRGRRMAAHRFCMLSAVVCSSCFLVSYLVYHYKVGSVPFRGEGWPRTVYFAVLISHAGLAALVVPMAFATLSRALKEHFAGHRRLARWTLPIWLYVSVTGVVVYWMLYHVYPGS
jgi:uncharacterized membrane protein YozB (DUF420 family)